jgi:opacity protein-like surface antigen
MFRFAKQAFVAALFAGLAAPTIAADLVDPPIVEAAAPVYGGWYIRGYIGGTNQDLDTLDTDLYNDPSIISHGWFEQGTFGSSPLFGGGVGYKFTDWIRGDLTVEYRGKSEFNAVDWVDSSFNGLTTNDYSGQKSEWLMLANAYVDLGNFSGVTPYLGAGIGASRNTISGFRDVNELMSGAAWAEERSKWNFAWALHAGLGIQATDRMTVDLGYSYVSLGDVVTGPLNNDDPAFTLPNNGMVFKDLTSHDFKLGIRYALY